MFVRWCVIFCNLSCLATKSQEARLSFFFRAYVPFKDAAFINCKEVVDFLKLRWVQYWQYPSIIIHHPSCIWANFANKNDSTSGVCALYPAPILGSAGAATVPGSRCAAAWANHSPWYLAALTGPKAPLLDSNLYPPQGPGDIQRFFEWNYGIQTYPNRLEHFGAIARIGHNSWTCLNFSNNWIWSGPNWTRKPCPKWMFRLFNWN